MFERGQETERALLSLLVPNLEAEGFQVFVHPSRSLLPPFMQDYRPDAIALRGDRKMIIEVTRDGSPTALRLDRLQRLIAEHPGWELRLVHARPREAGAGIPPSSSQEVERGLAQLPHILAAAGPLPALLTAWSVLEAAARPLLPAGPEVGRPAGWLVEFLASWGYVTPDEADLLRQLAARRNEAAHGHLDARLTEEELTEMARITREVMAQGAEASSDQGYASGPP